VAHEICYTLEHTPGLKDKRWEGNLAGIHPDSIDNCQNSNGSKMTVLLAKESYVARSRVDHARGYVTKEMTLGEEMGNT